MDATVCRLRTLLWWIDGTTSKRYVFDTKSIFQMGLSVSQYVSVLVLLRSHPYPRIHTSLTDTTTHSHPQTHTHIQNHTRTQSHRHKIKPGGLRPSNLAIFFLIRCTMILNLYIRNYLSASCISRGDNSSDHPVLNVLVSEFMS